MTQPLRVVPPGRQGPGPLPASAVARVDFALARRAGGVLPGEHRSPGAGTGTELAQLRPYEVGDDPRLLDPAASARTGTAHVRLQVPERALTTWVVLDISPSMSFGTGDRLKSDVAAGVAEVIGQAAVRRGGRVALATAGAPEPRVLPPRGGRGALAAVRRVLDEGVGPDGAAGPSLGETLARVRRLARTRGMVVVASDLRDEGWERPLQQLGARHATLAVEIRDPREGELPDAGHILLVDPETGAEVEADTSSPRLRRRFAELEAERREGVAAAVRRAGAAHVIVTTHGEWLRELARRIR